MYIIASHKITDPDRFFSMINAGVPIPEGLILHAFYPAQNNASATCLWEAATTGMVTAFLEKTFGEICTNECIPINATQAIGLPQKA